MAVVTILLSCALGSIAGLFQLAFLDASFGQAFLTYMAVSLVLSTSAIGAGVVITLFWPARDDMVPARQDDMETWQDWYAEEVMEADRLDRSAERSAGSLAEIRPCDSSQTLRTSRLAEATAYSARRAGKV